MCMSQARAPDGEGEGESEGGGEGESARLGLGLASAPPRRGPRRTDRTRLPRCGVSDIRRVGVVAES